MPSLLRASATIESCGSTSTTTRRRPPLPESSSDGHAVLTTTFGNASSVHAFGQRPRRSSTTRARTGRGAHRRRARARSSSPAAAPRRTTWRCAAPPRRSSRRAGVHLITSGIEHEAVLNTLKALERRGWTRDAAARSTRRASCSRRRSQAAITPRDGARLGDARQQRGRDDSADRRARGHRARARRAVPHRRRAVGRQDSGRRCARSASICCRSRRTSSAARRASARCGSGAACG